MHTQEKTLKLRDGVELYLQVSERACNKWLIHSHGIGEHSGRHNYIQTLFGHNFNILQYDLRGHGKSGGKRAFVQNFYDYMKDLQEIVTYLRSHFKMREYVLMGHSMGGLVTAGFVQSFIGKEYYPKLIHLSSPCVSVGGLGELPVKFLPTSFFKNLSMIPLGVQVSGLVNLSYLSHDPRVKQDYLNDPLSSLSAHTKLLTNLVTAAKEVFSKPLRPKCPAFVSIGSADKIVSYTECVQYFSLVEKGFKLKVFNEAYHEIHNEVDKYKIPYLDYLKSTIESCLYDSNIL
jgi:acylglycerol lipase